MTKVVNREDLAGRQLPASQSPPPDFDDIDQIVSEHLNNSKADDDRPPSRSLSIGNNADVDDAEAGGNLGDDDAEKSDDGANLDDLPADAKPVVETNVDTKPKKPRVVYPKLNAIALLDTERGLPKLMEIIGEIKWQGKGYEANNLNKLLFQLERWAKHLYPRWNPQETIERVEELGKKREIKVFAKKIFEDIPTCIGIDPTATGPGYVLQEDVDEETVPMKSRAAAVAIAGGGARRLDDDDDVNDDEDVFANLNQQIDNSFAVAEDLTAGKTATAKKRSGFKKRRRNAAASNNKAADDDDADAIFANLRENLDADRPAPIYAEKPPPQASAMQRTKVSARSRTSNDEEPMPDPFADFNFDSLIDAAGKRLATEHARKPGLLADDDEDDDDDDDASTINNDRRHQVQDEDEDVDVLDMFNDIFEERKPSKAAPVVQNDAPVREVVIERVAEQPYTATNRQNTSRHAQTESSFDSNNTSQNSGKKRRVLVFDEDDDDENDAEITATKAQADNDQNGNNTETQQLGSKESAASLNEIQRETNPSKKRRTYFEDEDEED